MNDLPPVGVISLDAVRSSMPDDLARAAPPAGHTGTVAFTDLISRGLDQVNAQLQVGQTGLQRLATGDTQNLHELMIQLEQSRLSFQLMMQVRGRLLEAYQDIMKMQV